jgi:hypothetical protein
VDLPRGDSYTLDLGSGASLGPFASAREALDAYDGNSDAVTGIWLGDQALTSSELRDLAAQESR